jgi:RecG-like helicase
MTSLTSPIHDSVDVLPGVGPKKKKAFADLGVHQVKDLLGLLPKSYQLRHRRLIADLEEGEHAIVVAQVLRLRFIGRARFRRLEVVVKDESGVLKLVFFNPSDMNVNDRFAANATITVLGLVANYAGIKQMAHPRVFSEDKSESLEGLWPAYAELKGFCIATTCAL